MIGEFLYGLTIKEQISAPVIQRWRDSNGAIANLTQINIDFAPVPVGMVLAPRQLANHSVPNAGVVVTGANWTVYAGNNFIGSLAEFSNWGGPAGQKRWSSPIDGVLLFPGERLRLSGYFDLIGVANEIGGTYWGLLFPQGTLQMR